MRVDKNGGYVAKLNGNVISSKVSAEFAGWNLSGLVTLQFGDFDGWIDEVVVRSSTISSGGGPNVSPTVTLTSTAAALVAPATVTLVPAAVDPDGSVVKVEFFDGTTRLGESTTAPFRFTWTGVFAGTHTVTARATDNRGTWATSTPISVVVTAASGTGTNTAAGATLVTTDTTTHGNWRGVYGAEGYKIIGDAQRIPTYATLSQSGATEYVWSASTSDARALQKASGTDRLAAVWYSGDSFNMDFAFNDGRTHRVSVYVMDWDRNGRTQKFEVVDPSNVVLSTVEVSDFAEGKYLTWDLRGNVRIRATRVTGNNAIVEGIFFDAAPQPDGPPSLRMVGFTQAGPQLQITGKVGATYRIQSSDDMKSWSDVGQTTLAVSPAPYVDVTPAGSGVRIYRIAPLN
jgi:hypothetical protein